MKPRTAEHITAQHDTFMLFGLLVLTRDDIRDELTAYRERVRCAAGERVRIAQACMNGLNPRTAMLLLNATLEEERTV